jgi:hypothetical protein
MGVIKHVHVYEDPGGWTWKITKSSDEFEPRPIARGPSFSTKYEAMSSMFGLFFGDYDESFLALYAEWNPEAQFIQTEDVGEPVSVPDTPQMAGNPPWGDSDPAL